MNKIDDHIILTMYKDGMPMHRIADELGIAIGTVYNKIKPYGISRPKNLTFKGHHHTDEAKEKLRNLHLGRKVSEESKKKMSESKKLKGKGYRIKRQDGYIKVFYPTSEYASKDGTVLEHRLVVEEYLGRKLKPDEVVHHINHIRDDNRIENLMVMTMSEHTSFHQREKKGR